jgi:hypothetical protein
MSATPEPRTEIINQVKLLLADQMIDLEADPEHYNLAIDMAIEKLRQASDGANEEANLFFTLQPEQTEYTLPDEVQNIRRLYRRGVGANTTGGTNFDPFEAAFSNIYLLQAGRTGGLATWDLFAQFQESIGRVFGSEINFTWNPSTKKLKIIRRIQHEEDISILAYIQKPEHVMIRDPYMRPWIRDYAKAQVKMMVGEARSKFTGGLPGPNGNVILNGADLKNEAIQEIEVLEQQLRDIVTGDAGYAFLIG